jgi:Xaa-Pro aminopeptidase
MGAFEKAAERVRQNKPLLEGELADWIRDRLYEKGLENQPDCHVAIGKNAADPHYDPGQKGDYISKGEILLIDLWGKESTEGVFADQTWMGILDRQVPPRSQKIWTAVRDAREKAIKFLHDSHTAGEKIFGYQVDDVCRHAISKSGFGNFFVHRTGHSMDVDLHGSGPNLDNLETRDDRTLIAGVGFSVEPGIYIPDEVGIRSEINVYWGPEGPEVTPKNRQYEILTLLE